MPEPTQQAPPTEQPGQASPAFFDVRRDVPVAADVVRRRISEPDAPVLVDFDYTLFAANSTELFIARCRPALLAAIIEFLVRGCVPWRLVPGGRGYRVRDCLCVVLLVVLMPWNLRRWRRDAPALFAEHRAGDIVDFFVDVDRSRLTVISFGMSFVIRDLLRGSELESAALRATPAFPRPSWFAGGKTATAVGAIGADGVARAVFVTDSLDDADLLGECRSGLLIAPQGERMLARERLYVPMRYTTRVKYSPGYTLDQLFLVDALLLAIAVSYDVASLLHFVVIAPLLLLSVMAVYEIGYVENDMHAASSEENPVLDPGVERFRDYPIRLQAWVWAAGFAAAGLGAAVLLDELDTDDLLRSALAWAVLLVVMRGVFYTYNRTPTGLRMFLYPVLQAFKYGAIFLVFLPTVLGVVLVLSQVMAMWMKYVVYRLGGRKEALDNDLVRTLAFLVAAALLGVATLVHGGPLGTGVGREQADLVCFVVALLWSLARVGKAPLMRRVRSAR